MLAHNKQLFNISNRMGQNDEFTPDLTILGSEYTLPKLPIILFLLPHSYNLFTSSEWHILFPH